MALPPRPLLVLHSNGAFRDRVRRVGGTTFRCTFLPSWDRLRQALTDASPAAILVVDPYLGTARPAAPALSTELRRLLWEFPSSTVLAVIEPRPGQSRDLRTLGEWGVQEVISIGEDDTEEAIQRRLRGVEGRSLQALLHRTLPPSVSGRARMLLMTSAEVVAVGGKGRDLAKRLHLSERTVLRWTERAALPAPRRLMAWMRILMASALLDDPGRTVLSAARSCGYATDGSLRRAMQDFLSESPTALRHHGAFRSVASAFLAELERLRAVAREAADQKRAALALQANRRSA